VNMNQVHVIASVWKVDRNRISPKKKALDLYL